MNFRTAKETLNNTRLDPDIAEAIGVILDTTERLQKALALASRTIFDWNDCPATSVGLLWTECGKNICGRRGPECWQRYLRERARSDQICRVCGYTDDNAGLRCTWVEADLCSRCAELRK